MHVFSEHNSQVKQCDSNALGNISTLINYDANMSAASYYYCLLFINGVEREQRTQKKCLNVLTRDFADKHPNSLYQHNHSALQSDPLLSALPSRVRRLTPPCRIPTPVARMVRQRRRR